MAANESGGELDNYTLPIPSSVVKLVLAGHLTWAEVEAAATTMFQSIVDDVFIRRHVVSMEPVFERSLRRGYSVEDLRVRHFFLFRELGAALTEAVTSRLATHNDASVVGDVFRALLSSLPPEIAEWIAEDKREEYFAALFFSVVSMITTSINMGFELAFPDGIPLDSSAYLAEWETVVTTGDGSVYLVLVREGGVGEAKKAKADIRATSHFYLNYVEGRPTQTYVYILTFAANLVTSLEAFNLLDVIEGRVL